MSSNQAESGQKSHDLAGEAAAGGDNIIPMAEYSAYTGEELLRVARNCVEKLGIDAGLREDAVQEFCLGALEAAAKEDKGRGIRAYQYKSGRGTVLNFLRRCQKHAQLHSVSYDAEECFADGEAVNLHTTGVEKDERATGLNEMHELLCRATEALPACESQVIRCRYLFDLTQNETAQKLGISRRKVRCAESRIKAWLGKQLKATNGGRG